MKKVCCSFVLCAALTCSALATEIDLSARSAIVIDGATGAVVYEKNARAPMAMASTTKIMTAMIALEASDMDEIVTVSEKAAAAEGSSMYLQAGEKVQMRDLLYGLMLASGNDAANAISEHIAPTMAHFATLMNNKAKLLGCENTSFENPSGLDGDNHYTTSYELAQITRHAMENEDFRALVSTRSITLKKRGSDENRYLTNHNRMLSMYLDCIGVKTGYTMKSGRTLVSAARRNGREFIAVTLSAPNDWQDHTKLLDYAFANAIQPTLATNPLEDQMQLRRTFLQSFLQLINKFFSYNA